jgi:hypothetical protein
MKKFELKKAKILLTLPVALISFKLYVGAVLGYFFAKILAGRIDSMLFDVGNHQIHFHHWILGAIGLTVTLLVGFSPLIRNLLYGFSGGLVFEGVVNYPDWYKIIIKKKEEILF